MSSDATPISTQPQPQPQPQPDLNRSTPNPQVGEQQQTSQQQQQQTLVAGGAPARVYMNEKIVPYLLEGMKAVAKEQYVFFFFSWFLPLLEKLLSGFLLFQAVESSPCSGRVSDSKK